jgi:hypothetical protein
MPQVIAAISAILAVFLFRRLETLKSILIGDGTAILNRSSVSEYDFLFEEDLEAIRIKKWQDKRLRDGINRKDIEEIKKVIEFYGNQEQKAEEKGKKINKESGLQNFYRKFSNTEELFNNIIFFAKITFFTSIASILLSVICLAFTDVIYSNCLSSSAIAVNLIVFILSITMTVVVIIKSFSEKGSN